MSNEQQCREVVLDLESQCFVSVKTHSILIGTMAGEDLINVAWPNMRYSFSKNA